VINKWDLLQDAGLEERQKMEMERRKNRKRDDVEKRLTSLADFEGWVQEQLFFLDYAPVLFTSAKTGFHLDRLLETVRYVGAQLQQKIPTSLLNRTLRDAVEKRQPVSAAGHRLKFFYATQVKESPPIFILFVNRDELFSDNYRKYLANEMRAAFGYEGCPILMIPKPRPKTVESVRDHQPPNPGMKLPYELRPHHGRKPNKAMRSDRGGKMGGRAGGRTHR
jgi:hypothetical protein